jgi:PAS domain S-box-containing protein
MLVNEEALAQVLLRELSRQQGVAHIHQRVDTKAEFLAALKLGIWDAVIADFSLQHFSCLEALNSLRKLGLDMPFIIVSGIYGEELAVEMLKAGANDYLMKVDLSRLGLALERELKAAADRRQRQRAEGATQYLAAIIESSDDAIYGKNLDGIIVSWNPAAERIYGYSAEEIIGKSITVLFPSHRAEELLTIMSAIRRGEIINLQDTERRHKSGKSIPISVTISPIKDGQGNIIGASAIARDISRLKQMEWERQELIKTLTAKVNDVHTLAGMLPICAACKRIRNDQGYWQMVEEYIGEHSAAVFSHGLCPECIKEYERSIVPPKDIGAP